ncbi:hypothetical protein CSPX01_01172 [Colletotrichum filicis]|nr:hypothetical protein CSPX01_01172 [Colletotrichum filicis]
MARPSSVLPAGDFVSALPWYGRVSQRPLGPQPSNPVSFCESARRGPKEKKTCGALNFLPFATDLGPFAAVAGIVVMKAAVIECCITPSFPILE